ncbi:MAG: hypothetical protein DRJ40_06915 [Thermoprotei archaeon]|nr:MAG: hypothetical protein DRJ40_06915 [Thermoprotei archaeon]
MITSLPELPRELVHLYEVVEEGGQKHWKCRRCGTRVCSVEDAIYHAVTHDPRLKRLLRELKLE